mgnify:FL=1|tara:strand:+ start:2100 stop:2762 length:663 start_codon:yes stop_codon:yes gene_type:complete
MAVTVNINDKKWEIPTRVTIEEWRDLQQWEFTNQAHWPWIVSTISSFDAREFDNADPDSMQLFIGFLIAACNKRTLKVQPDFNQLKFGQFVDLDCFLALGVEKNIAQILEILEVDTPWADEALAVIDQYLKWRATIYKQYSQLFGLNNKDGLPNDDEFYDPKEVARGWYMVIMELADNNILRMDEVTEEPLQKTLTFLQIQKELKIKEAQEARKITNKKL